MKKHKSPGVAVVCSVWRVPNETGICEVRHVEVTEAEILKLVESKAQIETGWLESELYTLQVEHIRP
jgi:hypothetical protein